MNPNNYENQKKRALLRKYEEIMRRGGACEICGYCKNIAALEFHHKNPEEKEFNIDMRKFSNMTLEKLEAELEKCILVCANCHRELHNKSLTMENILNLLENVDKTTFSNRGRQICPVCGKRFKKSKGKIYCSKECRMKAKNYPTKQEIFDKYQELHSWQKVADFYNITRRIVQRIRVA